MEKFEHENGRINAAIVLETTRKELHEIEEFVSEKTGTNLIFVKKAPHWVKLRIKEDSSSREGIERNDCSSIRLRETKQDGC